MRANSNSSTDTLAQQGNLVDGKNVIDPSKTVIFLNSAGRAKIFLQGKMIATSTNFKIRSPVESMPMINDPTPSDASVNDILKVFCTNIKCMTAEIGVVGTSTIVKLKKSRDFNQINENNIFLVARPYVRTDGGDSGGGAGGGPEGPPADPPHGIAKP